MTGIPKVHAMCLVKNEDDVIEETLRAASQWCDHIYVLDTGSTDNTWKIVERLRGEPGSKITSVARQKVELFSDGLRSLIYNQHSHLAQPGDWWCRLDADEIYADEPRSFLKAVDARYGAVYYASLSYYFSSAAAAEYEQQPEKFADSVPVAQRCRYYHNHWSELRFARHEAMGRWMDGESQGWPRSAMAERVCPARILCKHYCYRSPTQIEKRIATRKAVALSGKVFGHEAIKNWAQTVDPKAKHKDIAYATLAQDFEEGWRSRVIPADSLQFDAHDGRYVVSDELMPPLPCAAEPPLRTDVIRVTRRLLRKVTGAVEHSSR